MTPDERMKVAKDFANLWDLGGRINSDLYIQSIADLLSRAEREAKVEALSGLLNMYGRGDVLLTHMIESRIRELEVGK
jgi:hypothetical protein